jgi:hypothetical protein
MTPLQKQTHKTLKKPAKIIKKQSKTLINHLKIEKSLIKSSKNQQKPIVFSPQSISKFTKSDL